MSYIVLKKHKKAWHRSTEIRKTYLTELVLEQKFMEQFVRFTLPKLHGCKFMGLVLMASALPCASSFGDIVVYFLTKMMTLFSFIRPTCTLPVFYNNTYYTPLETHCTALNVRIHSVFCAQVFCWCFQICCCCYVLVILSLYIFSIRLSIFICSMYKHQ